MIRFSRAAGALLAILSFFPFCASAVETSDYSVQVSSTVQALPPQITLTWLQQSEGTPAGYTVYRKAPGATSWGRGTALPGTATSFVDRDVEPSVAYEYRVVKETRAYKGFGYIQTAVHAPLVDRRGSVLLLVDDTFTAPLAAELSRLELDLVGDGWTVLRRDVRRTDSVATIKRIITATYAANRASLKSVFLFGHIAVPYSGQLNPDGHPDHVGAWPADAYYGDMDGRWTDEYVNYRQTLNGDADDAARISNFPGDGKFDQTVLPSAVELQVGRVDLANMPGRVAWDGPAIFPSELELMRRYLDKDHAFRHRLVNPPRRAALGDYFGIRGGEAFAASGFRGFAPLVGPENIRNLNTEFAGKMGVWVPELARTDYLLAYGCGPGNYTTMAGLGNSNHYNDATTTEFVDHNIRATFNLLFGSWLGDWDHEDDFLRAPLATDYGLISIWSGRPHWFIHPLGLGETFGYITQLAQNNDGLYETHINSAARRIHIALMGDPTLRLHAVAPATNLNGTALGNAIELAWMPSSDTAVIGYHVYRATSLRGPFARLTRTPVAETRFVDASREAQPGAVYMVRTVKLESTPSGSYENAAQGVFWSAAADPAAVIAAASQPVRPPRAAEIFSSDAATSPRAADTAALTIASSGVDAPHEAGAASGEPALRSHPAPAGNVRAGVVSAPSDSN